MMRLATLMPHGRRAVLTTVLALLAVVGLGLYAGAATLGTAEPTTTTAATTTPVPDAASDSTSNGGGGGNGDQNAAVAVNTKDGSTVYAVRLKVVLTNDPVVDAGNAAVAAASCTDCTTVAIAMEGVVVFGQPEAVVPVNLAIALNQDCTNCRTLAAAYQTVIQTATRVRITGAGRKAINDLRHQLSALRKSGLDIVQVKAEVDRIAAEFKHILQTEIVPVHEGKGPSDATPTPEASATANPDATTAAPSGPSAPTPTMPADGASAEVRTPTPTDTPSPPPPTPSG